MDNNSNKCRHCEAELPANSKKTFCNRSCSASHNNLGVRRHGKDKSLCLVCGNTVKRNSSKFCSVTCSAFHRHQSLVFKCIDKQEVICSPGKVRGILISIRGHQCSVCLLSEWNSLPIPLEADHIDGNSDNNLLSNLRLICCNCHAQTTTYKGKNMGKGRHYRRKRYAAGQSY